MATIDLKLKTYEQLQFEVQKLITDKYLLERELGQYKNIIKEVRECINEGLCQGGERELRDFCVFSNLFKHSSLYSLI